MQRQIPVWLVVILFIGVTISLGISCGKKAPPEPPVKSRLPGIDRLSLEREGNRVALSWTVEKVEDKALRDLAGFHVLRARRELPPNGCEKCPLAYAIVGNLDYENTKAPAGPWYFEDNPASGFAYFYKVRGYSAKGTAGPDSETVDVVIAGDGR